MAKSTVVMSDGSKYSSNSSATDLWNIMHVHSGVPMLAFDSEAGGHEILIGYQVVKIIDNEPA